MKFVAGFVLLICTFCNAELNQTQELDNSAPSSLRSARIAGATTITTSSAYPWFVIIHDQTTSKDVAQGAIKSAYWVITTASAVTTYKNNPGKLVVLIGKDKRTDTKAAPSARMVNQIITHELASGSKNDLALVRVCPKIKSGFATISSTGIVFTAGVATTLLSYEKSDLSTASKNVGDKCECSDTYPAVYDSKMDICLQEHQTIYSDADDLKGVAVIRTSDKALIGLVTLPQANTGGGEIAVDVTEYNTWFTNNARYP